MRSSDKIATRTCGLELPDEPIALVSGGGSGIGAAVCARLGAMGAEVGVLDVDEAACHDTVSELAKLGQEALALEADITDISALDQAVYDLEAAFGKPPSIVVHNAGWTGPNAPFAELGLEDQSRIVAVNYVGALHTVRATLPGMIRRGGGSYLFVSSDAAKIGTPKEAVYSGAKAAIVAFAKALSVEVARHEIRVNVVSPGSTDTPLIRQILTPEQIERRKRANPMRRLGTPADVAEAAAFLVSRNAGFITGQVLSVNGGMTRLG